MSIVSIFLVLFSASIHVWWNFLVKSSQNPKVFSLLKVTVMMGFAAVTVPCFPLQDIPREVWIYIILSGIIHGLYILSLSSAYEVGDISYVYTITDKAGMSAFSEVKTIAPVMQGPLFLLLENVLCCLLFWTYMILRSDEKFRSILSHEWPKPAIAALGTFASYSLILYVMRIEKVNYIVTMRQASVLIAVLVGWLLLKERYGKMRLVASVIMFMGFYLVGTAK